MEPLPNTPGDLVRRSFDLTVALFRVTDCFREPDRYKRELREKAYRILRRMFELEIGSAEDRAAVVLEIRTGLKDLDRAFRQAQKQGALHPVNFQVLRREYGRLASALAAYGISVEVRTIPSLDFLNSRQGEILGYLKAQGGATVPELLALFPGGGVSRRTLERDLSFLLQTRALRRLGDKRWAKYTPLEVSNAIREYDGTEHQSVNTRNKSAPSTLVATPQGADF